MLFNIEKQSLLKAIGYAYSIIEKKSAIPVLSYFMFEAAGEILTIKATDLDNSIVVKLDADVKRDGSVLINAQTFYDILRKTTDEIITCESFEACVQISSKTVKFTLNTLNPEEFPEITSLRESRKFNIKKAVFKKLLDLTYFSMSSDESRYNLNGVLLHSEDNKIAAVATDVHRLSLVESKCDTTFEKFSFILSRKTVNECRKMLDSVDDDNISISFSDVYISFSFSNITFTSRLVEGNFPEYKHIIPKELSNIKKFTINRKTLTDALSRVSIIVDEKSPVVRATIKSGYLCMNVINSNKGNAEEKLDINYVGNEETLGFNPRYIIDVLTNLSSDELTFFFKDSLSAIIIKDETDVSATFMVMPMLIS